MPATGSVLRDNRYGPGWEPDPAKMRIKQDLCLGDFVPAERKLRLLADDQAISVGYACGTSAHGYLPLEHWTAIQIARELFEEMGPEGKVLVVLDDERIRDVTLSVHHLPGADAVEVNQAALRAIERASLTLLPAIAELAASLRTVRPRVNGARPFSIGGPMGDNGLSGKKLVCEGAGTSVPIGGGAQSGKDPHKIDRAGALAARALAVARVKEGRAEARVTLAWAPGDPVDEPCAVEGTTPTEARSALRAAMDCGPGFERWARWGRLSDEQGGERA